mmetsp:Transcript_82476/g.160861  ORF Transcript_82476/g.160861 Transcript_82476/m.160861 type:complete len:511 (+) Transcript_82476:40-1572(+)
MCSKPVDGETVPAWFDETGPQITFHAAAHHDDFGVANASQRRTTPVPRWNELTPEIPPTNEEETKRLADGASYMASRGPDGIVELRRWIAVGSGQQWLRRTQVHGAVANNWVEPIKLCLTHPDVLSDVNGVDKDGLTPLHFAAIWGRPNLAVLLLSLGGDPTLQDLRSGNTPFDTARQRLAKLLQPKLDQHKDIEYMRVEGLELAGIFEGLHDVGNDYAKWAYLKFTNRYVQRHSPRLIAHRQRAELCLLRELVLRSRATVRTAVEVAELEQAKAEAEAALLAEAAGPPKTLEGAMEEAGLLKEGQGSQARSGRKIMMRQMHKFLEVSTLEDLKGVTRQDIAELDEIDPAERRMLWQFVSQHQPEETFAMAMQAEKKKSGGGAAAAASKASSKKKEKSAKSKGGTGGSEDGDLASLLAEGAKIGKAGKSAKNCSGASKAANKSTGGVATLEKTGAAAAESSSGGSDPTKERKADAGYQRHWPDDSSVLTFMFREDLPTDAFASIAVFLFN